MKEILFCCCAAPCGEEVQQTAEFFDPSPCFVLGDSSPQLSVTLSLPPLA